MAVLVGNHTKLIVQGITGREGLFHAKGSRDYGTNVVGGVVPGKGGERYLDIATHNAAALVAGMK